MTMQKKVFSNLQRKFGVSETEEKAYDMKATEKCKMTENKITYFVKEFTKQKWEEDEKNRISVV